MSDISSTFGGTRKPKKKQNIKEQYRIPLSELTKPTLRNTSQLPDLSYNSPDPMGDGSVMSSYTPNIHEKASDVLRRNLFTDDRAGQAKADRLVNVVETMFPPAGAAGMMYDAGRAGGQGDMATAGALGAMAVLPGGKAMKDAGKTGVKAAAAAVAKKAPLKRMTQLPNLREMPAKEAIKAARKEQHLIPSADTSEGLYIGGPRNFKDRKDLLKMRRDLDATVARDPRGGDWYDRTRAGINEVTGGNPTDNLWMSNKHGQFSAGVDPGSELHFSIKDTNSAIASGGVPVKAARPAQQKASQAAIEAKDPSKYQLGKKTGEYARRINPNQAGPETATGVNDFRHARNLGYTEPDGTPQRGALGNAAHAFADHETALAVGRANKANLGGRDNWTGEQFQAAPWVIQKGDDLFSRQHAGYRKRATEELIAGGSNASPDEVEKLAREYAFQDANRTIGDFYDRHTAFATYETQPGASTGHLPGAAKAPQYERDAFARDPRNSWATAPGGRDAIYAGMGVPGTGDNMRVRPTQEMQGLFTSTVPGAQPEFNIGNVARPLVTFDSGKVKTLTKADQDILNAGEAFRGYVDAQDAGAWHKPWVGGAPGQSNSAYLTKSTPGRATPDEMMRLKAIGEKQGLPNVVDTNHGVTLTDFEKGAPARSSKDQKALAAAAAISDPKAYKSIERSKVDAGYLNYADEWQMPQGQGHVTRKMFDYLDSVPRPVFDAIDRNPDLDPIIANKMALAEENAAKWGGQREDLVNARRILSSGPGRLTRLREAMMRGEVVPAVALPLLGGIMPGSGGEDQDNVR